MKTTKNIRIASGLALAALLAALAGCASSGGNYQKANTTAAGLQASADSITAGSAQIDTTLAALNDLVNTPGDLKTQFTKYSAAVDGLQTCAQDVKTKVTAMRSAGADYFKAWDEQAAQIKNEDIKSRSAARRNEVQEKFTAIKLSYTQTGDAFRPFMSDLTDIRTALSTDLTTGGVAAIKGATDTANKHAEPLKAAVAQLSSDFKDLGVAMASAAPPPPPAGATTPAMTNQPATEAK